MAKKKGSAVIAEKPEHWAKRAGRITAFCPLTQEENEDVRLAAVLAGARSKASFIREAAVAAAREVLRKHKVSK